MITVQIMTEEIKIVIETRFLITREKRKDKTMIMLVKKKKIAMKSKSRKQLEK